VSLHGHYFRFRLLTIDAHSGDKFASHAKELLGSTDFNESLVVEWMSGLTPTWRKAFGDEIANPLQPLPKSVEKKLTAFHDAVVSRKDIDIPAQSQQLLKEQLHSHAQAVSNWTEIILKHLRQGRWDAAELPRPHVKEHMAPCYDRILEETGT
jgi:hypothetical protein